MGLIDLGILVTRSGEGNDLGSSHLVDQRQVLRGKAFSENVITRHFKGVSRIRAGGVVDFPHHLGKDTKTNGVPKRANQAAIPSEDRLTLRRRRRRQLRCRAFMGYGRQECRILRKVGEWEASASS